MSLYDRLLLKQTPHISAHAFLAAGAEFRRGKMTAQEVVDLFLLDAGEQAEAVEFFGQMIDQTESISIGSGPITLTNVGTAYDGIAASQGLGSVIIQTAGITRAVFGARFNRNGSGGTISWQFFNETDGNEVAVINDTTGANAKNVSVAVDFPSPLGAGVKVCRIRCKSTTPGDDPIFLGGALLVTRLAVLTSQEAHEVLMLYCYTKNNNPRRDVAALKTRIGLVA